MKRLTLLVILLFCVTCLCAGSAENALPAFGDVTGLDSFLAGVSEDDPIVSVYFTQGYGFSVAEFSAGDPQRIGQAVSALKNLEITDTTNMDVTDWYPHLRMRRESGAVLSVSFDGEWLEIGRTHYVLTGIKEFYGVMNRLIKETTEDRHTLYLNGTPADLLEITLRDFTDAGFEAELHPEDGIAYLTFPGCESGMTVGMADENPDSALTYVNMAFADDLPVMWCGGNALSGPEYWENELDGMLYEHTDEDEFTWECADFFFDDHRCIRFTSKGDAPCLYIDR